MCMRSRGQGFFKLMLKSWVHSFPSSVIIHLGKQTSICWALEKPRYQQHCKFSLRRWACQHEAQKQIQVCDSANVSISVLCAFFLSRWHLLSLLSPLSPLSLLCHTHRIQYSLNILISKYSMFMDIRNKESSTYTDPCRNLHKFSK